MRRAQRAGSSSRARAPGGSLKLPAQDLDSIRGSPRAQDACRLHSSYGQDRTEAPVTRPRPRRSRAASARCSTHRQLTNEFNRCRTQRTLSSAPLRQERERNGNERHDACRRGRPLRRSQPLDQGDPRKWWILVAVSFGMFMALLDVTIVNIAMPAIIRTSATVSASASWVLNAVQPGAGGLLPEHGPDRPTVTVRSASSSSASSSFTLFSLLCGIAPNIELAHNLPRRPRRRRRRAGPRSPLAILLGAFPRRQHGTAVGMWGALGTAAAAVGPTLGGLLVTTATGHWIFFVNVPVGIVAVIAWRDRHPARALGRRALMAASTSPAC